MTTKIKTLSATSLVIALVLALMPGTAQAEPHYYRNGVLLGSEPLPVITWGTLTFKPSLGAEGVITCHHVIAGSVENPEGGGAGTGQTESFDPYGCELNECPAELGLHLVLLAESLPWPSVLLDEGTTVRQRSTGVKLNFECLSGEAEVGGQKSLGSFEPSEHKGTSALHPSLVEFDPGSGELEGEGSEGKVKGKIEGKLRVLGYEEDEVINAKEK